MDLDYEASYMIRCAQCRRWLQGVNGGKQMPLGPICNLCVRLNTGWKPLDHQQLLKLLAAGAKLTHP